MQLDPPEHSLLIHSLEELADYGVFCRERSRPAVVRAVGYGIQRIIREQFEQLELGHNTTQKEDQ